MRIGITSVDPIDDPNSYEVVYTGFVGEGVGTTFNCSMEVIMRRYSAGNVALAASRLLVLDRLTAAAMYPCAKDLHW